ncbi:MAG: CYTH and CHAD domain-containing protein [Frankiaceae bacterium]|nr:CYTH and CHAD domain-containing protein [Frankiaceae bacterium]
MSAAKSTTREVEAKFRVHPPFELPSLIGERTGAGSVDTARNEQLVAIYWDTSDLRLAREGVTLRHRSGEGPGKDGWHLKLPVREGRVPDAGIASRDELHEDGEPDTIPDALRDLVSPWTRTAVIGPVATLVTQRAACLLRDPAGNALVELTDDLVSVMSSGHVAGRFREIEVEDCGGGVAAIEAVGAVLRAGGAVAGEFLPKVVRALGPQATADPDPPVPVAVGLDEPARCAVRDVLRRNVRALVTNDVAVRRDLPDAVHQVRVTARRMRSTLKTFGPILDPEWATSLRTELKWLADEMAGARDSEVLLNRLLRDLDGLDDEVVVGPVRARLEREIGERLKAGGDRALQTLRSERYVVLLERLVDAAWEPMTSPDAEEPVITAIPAYVNAAWQRLAKAAKRLESKHAVPGDWHTARIRAKELRYACDAVTPIYGKAAKSLAKQAETVQEVLGEHQDAVIAADTLRGIATGRGAGNVAFTLGLLHSRQTEAAASAQAEFWRVWAEASRSRHRKWLAT